MTIVNQTQGRIDKAREMTLSDGEKILLFQEFESHQAKSLANPSSAMSAALKKYKNVEAVR